jgi:hypothetical protein
MLLRIYHLHVDHLIPEGAPAALRQAFDNPLQLILKPPNLESAVSGMANARDLVRTITDGSRAGLISAMQSIFFVNAVALSVSCVLNALAGKARPRVRNAAHGGIGSV